MAKLSCSKSGIVTQVEHLPLAFSAPEFQHPMFQVPQKKLIGLASTWASGTLSDTESYLLYLALLDSTSLIHWRSPARLTPHTSSVVASNMESLLHIIGKINLIHHPSFTLPSFAISPETADLANSNHWIASWTSNYREWYDSHLDSAAREELKVRLDHREEALTRMIRSATPVERYASVLADWAAIAGQFPQETTPHPISGQPIELSEYWKHIIRSAGNDDRLWKFPRKDIVELIDHCEDNIPHGNIYAHTLMKYLREGLRKYDGYDLFGDIDLSASVVRSGTAFAVMPREASVYETNMAAISMTAPETEPKRLSYKTHFEWFKAYTKWKVSQSSGGKP